MKKKVLCFAVCLLLLSVAALFNDGRLYSSGLFHNKAAAPAAAPAAPAAKKPKYVRGIHLTAWVTGSSKLRPNVLKLVDETEVNTLVIDLKEYEGEVYLPGVKLADQYKTYVPAITDLDKLMAQLKSKGIYTIARIVVFKDNKMARRKPEWAVKTPEGEPWKDRSGNTWLDPYNPHAWDYNITIAEHAMEMGFDEIQFDYIRFPSDGNTKTCRYSQAHSTGSASAALVNFLKEANRRLKPKGAMIGIDVFGLTTTVKHDMGIGQKIVEMAAYADYVCPMVYPSHYAKGEYRIPDPNKAPYKTVYLGMEGAVKRLGGIVKLRPWLQDFSLGHRYGPKEVRAQIQASYDNNIGEWMLWNPRCVYTVGGLKEKKYADIMEKNGPEAIASLIGSTKKAALTAATTAQVHTPAPIIPAATVTETAK